MSRVKVTHKVTEARGKQRNSGSRFLKREGILRAVQQSGCTEAAEQGTQAPRQAAVWLVDPLQTQLLGGEGANLEVFPRHQATRGSPGACNSSSASILLSGPVPRGCYCRCRAAFSPPPTPSPPACPCPLHCILSPPHTSRLRLPHPIRASASFALHPSSLPSWFLSPHPEFVFITPSLSCKTASQTGYPIGSLVKKLGGFCHQGSPPAF